MELSQFREYQAWMAEYGFIRTFALRYPNDAIPIAGEVVGEPEYLAAGVETKFRITFQPKDQPQPLHLVTKRPNAFNPPLEPGETPASRFRDNWLVASGAGLPVPQLYGISDQVIAFPDLSADGSWLIGKAFAAISKIATRPATFVAAQAIFQKVNLDQVRARVQQYEALATAAKIRLPLDGAFELLLHPDSTWEIIMLELGSLWYGEQALSAPAIYATLTTENDHHAQQFLDDLAVISRW